MNKLYPLIVIMAILMLQIVAAASRPAELPILVYGQVKDEKGRLTDDASVLIKSYNPYTGALKVQKGAIMGSLKEKYYFIKYQNTDLDNLVVSAINQYEDGELRHKITDDENYKSFINLETIQMKSKTIVDPYCGDGLLDEIEECDDGNMINGDGCSFECKLESPEMKIELVSGWNKMILPKTPTDNTVEGFLSGVQYEIIWENDNGNKVYSQKVEAGDLEKVYSGVTYWIYVNKPVILTIR